MIELTDEGATIIVFESKTWQSEEIECVYLQPGIGRWLEGVALLGARLLLAVASMFPSTTSDPRRSLQVRRPQAG
jgi:hypothetical protein